MESPTTPDSLDHVLKDQGNFILTVSQFYNQEALSDVILKVGEARFHGHKFVLAKSSDVFRTMLYEKPWSQNVREEIELNETAECQGVFDRFLRYLYTAEISISTDSAIGILCLADKYNVASLKVLCMSYMVEHTRSPKVRNALNWYPWAKALHLENLIQQCTKTIAWNTDVILKSPQWISMDIDFVCDILESSELVTQSEFALFLALSQWLLDETHFPHLTEASSRLLPLIRFPQMKVVELHEVENSELAQREESSGVLMDLVGQAYRFRSLCPAQTELGIPFDEKFFLPRDYLDLAVDQVRIQNTLRFGIQVDVKTGVGPVPSTVKDGEWKITYRKSGDTGVWTVQMYCHESAMVNNEARIQASLVVFNEEDKVVQVERAPTCICGRTNSLTMQLTIADSEGAKNMLVLIKPVPH